MKGPTIKTLKSNLKSLSQLYKVQNKKMLLELNFLYNQKFNVINNLRKKLNIRYTNINKKNKNELLVDLFLIMYNKNKNLSNKIKNINDENKKKNIIKQNIKKVLDFENKKKKEEEEKYKNIEEEEQKIEEEIKKINTELKKEERELISDYEDEEEIKEERELISDYEDEEEEEIKELNKKYDYEFEEEEEDEEEKKIRIQKNKEKKQELKKKLQELKKDNEITDLTPYIITEKNIKTDEDIKTLIYNDNMYPSVITLEFSKNILFNRIYVKDLQNNFIENVALNIIQRPEHYVLMSYKVDGKKKYITLSKATQTFLENLILSKGISLIFRENSFKSSETKKKNYIRVSDAEEDFITSYTVMTDIVIEYRKVGKQTENVGKFFKYMAINELKKINLKRYQIFNDDYNFELVNNKCIIHCLENYVYEDGTKISNEIIDKLKLCVKNFGLPRKYIKKIAEEHNITIRIMMTNKMNIVYGKKENKEIKLCLHDGHYFIYDNKTGITSYALKNFEKIKHIKDWQKIYKCVNGVYKKSNKHFMTSLKLVSKLIKNHIGTLIQEIPREKLKNTIYINESNYISELNYNEIDVKLNEYKPHDKKVIYICGFDFETRTDKEYHEPYLVCYKLYRVFDRKERNEKGEEVIKKRYRMLYSNNKVGYNCAYEFLKDIHNFLTTKDIDTCSFMAHNISYDLKFIFKNLFDCKFIHRSSNNICTGSANFKPYDSNKILTINIIDSVAILPYRLKQFKNIFALDVKKEILPYEIYNSDLSLNINSIYKVSEGLKFVKEKHHKEFIKNINDWGLMLPNKKDFRHVKYSLKYCEMDVEVMMSGYFKFREWIWDDFKLDINNNSTISNLAYEILENRKCLKDCYAISSIPREFISKTIVGGRTMSRDNKKQININENGENIELGDFDACSLYPSAIFRLSGFLKGKPKIINEEQKNYNFLKSCDGYFIECKISNFRKRYSFPLLNYINENGTRIFSNDFKKDNIFNLNKIDIEDLITFEIIKPEDLIILRGYYYDEGRNEESKKLINELYQTRVIRKREKNPIQEAYKLIMNSIYGKTGLKEKKHEIQYIDSKEDMLKFYDNNYDRIKNCQQIPGLEKYKIKKAIPINEHFNYAQIASEILSMSKRIMNEVMTLAEDLEIKIYYQDTDSMHIDISKIDLLCDEYFKKYNRELRGNNMGQFHVDFEDLKKDNKTYKPIKAVLSLFLGKKMYIDYIKYVNDEDDTDFTFGYHCRMKGIPSKVLIKHANDYYDGDLYNLYLDIYNGKNINFNLLTVGIKFDNHDPMMCKNVVSFYRNIKI